MELSVLYEELTRAAERAGVVVRTEPYAAAFPDGRAPRGGLCVLRGQRVVVVDARAALPDRIATLAQALAQLDVADPELPAIVRATIGAHRREKTPAPPPAAGTPRPLARARRRG